MLDFVFLLMLFIFLIMFVSNLYLLNPIFGLLSGFWLIVIAGAILIDGIQIQSGMTITDVGGGVTNLTNNYTDWCCRFRRKPPVSLVCSSYVYPSTSSTRMVWSCRLVLYTI